MLTNLLAGKVCLIYLIDDNEMNAIMENVRQFHEKIS
jgi:hypothetical protein